ncbi:hypothetical protein SAMN02745126_02754 [Enhydrobacter aerosaccus]|uniref:Uncharacterized protein n=1 Tax=Enhydrobacter aerosaccus TaxID=225324 RepID=A0A1T4PD86_9HYPH|nr:hypothetical protein [Enhydrobacter aerosaccus]SJZ89523.1 hypothetical protein SAMN02745126_02754 [Enhydrobacter aerosaccus]
MIRPGVTLALWFALALMIVVNDMIGDTWIAMALTVRAVEWYKVLVPLPYVVLLAIIHARRTAGPRWFEAALLATLLWAPSTVLVDFLYAHWTFGTEAPEFLDRFAFWWGVPYPLLVLTLLAAPILAGWVVARSGASTRASRRSA